MPPFRFGVSAWTAGSREEWRDLARRAEAIGFDILHVPDHLTERLSPMTALCSAADATERIVVLSNPLVPNCRRAAAKIAVLVASASRLRAGMPSDYSTTVDNASRWA